MDWYRMHPARLLADIRQHRLSHDAQGVLVQLCATSAHYDGALGVDALVDEIRPILGRRKRAALLAELAPVLADYLGDVATQAADYLEKSAKARAAANARWDSARRDEGSRDAGAHADASTDAYSDAHTDACADAHAERERREIREKRENRSTSPSMEGDARFDRFWDTYPKKTAKADAVKAWRKLRPDDALLETMLAALAWQRTTKQWHDDGIIPNPATWLNGRRWEDERPANTQRGVVPLVDWEAV